MNKLNNRNSQQNLVGRIYKLLPIYEGKVLDTDKILDKDIAYNNFQKNINMLMLYLSGIRNRYGNNEYLENIIITLSGLKTVGKDSHSIVKSSVFYCVKTAERMADEYGLRGFDVD